MKILLTISFLFFNRTDISKCRKMISIFVRKNLKNLKKSSPSKVLSFYRKRDALRGGLTRPPDHIKIYY